MSNEQNNAQNNEHSNEHRGENAAGSVTFLLAALLAACGGGQESPQSPGTADAGGQLFVNLAKAPYRPDLISASIPPSAPASGVESKTKAARVASPSEFMDWVEATFPHVFPGHQTDVVYNKDPEYAGLLYRFYSGTGNYIALWQGICFFYGPVSGGVFANVGTLTQWSNAVFELQSIRSVWNPQSAARFLLHAQFSASEAEIAAVRQKGYAQWLDEQMGKPLGQTAREWAVTKGYSAVNAQTYFFNYEFAYFAVWQQLMASPDAVRKRCALALSEMLVVAIEGTMGLEWNGFAVLDYWDILNRETFGNFRKLLEDVTLCPAMGQFLNTLGNLKEDPKTGRVPDENYARELMQLFTIGLVKLNLDGTPQLGADGKPLETYTQSDVTQLARVFTGYNVNYTALPRFKNPTPPYQDIAAFGYFTQTMEFKAANHSNLEVNFLGTTIPANTPGPAALKIALDTLFNHPNVGPFVARQMIQRLVTSNPERTYVARVAAVFNDNGMGVRGDLRAMFKAVLTDRAALDPSTANDPNFGKIREPMLRIVQWARTFNVKSKRDTWRLKMWDGDPKTYIGQNPLSPSTVFNFFRPGYVPPATPLAATGATAPELQIVDDTSVAAYVNHLQNIVWSGYWVRAPELPYYVDYPTATDGPDIVPDYTTELSLVLNDTALVDRLDLLLCAGQLAPASKAFIVNALAIDKVNASWDASGRLAHFVRALLFVMCSADYIVQK